MKSDMGVFSSSIRGLFFGKYTQENMDSLNNYLEGKALRETDAWVYIKEGVLFTLPRINRVLRIDLSDIPLHMDVTNEPERSVIMWRLENGI
jgi:hypothetical protein